MELFIITIERVLLESRSDIEKRERERDSKVNRDKSWKKYYHFGMEEGKRLNVFLNWLFPFYAHLVSL